MSIRIRNTWVRRAIVCTVVLCSLFSALTVNAETPATKEDIINAAPLSPVTTGSEELNQLVLSILGDITTEEMDTHAKVRACYDYLIANITYGSARDTGTNIKQDTRSSYSSGRRWMGHVESMAYSTLINKAGHCGGFSSTFVVMCRAIGLDAYLASGETKAASGGYTGHKWVEIDINGATYLFDPQMEQMSVSWTRSDSYFFCSTYAKEPSRYIFSSRSGLTSPDALTAHNNRWERWAEEERHYNMDGTECRDNNRWKNESDEGRNEHRNTHWQGNSGHHHSAHSFSPKRWR